VQIAAARTRAAAERWRILAEDAVPRARQNVAASEAAYMAGQIDFVSLLDAQRMLLAEELAAERALAEHAARRAELARAVGGEE
jgi:outer membrane protein TolC